MEAAEKDVSGEAQSEGDEQLGSGVGLFDRYRPTSRTTRIARIDGLETFSHDIRMVCHQGMMKISPVITAASAVIPVREYSGNSDDIGYSQPVLQSRSVRTLEQGGDTAICQGSMTVDAAKWVTDTAVVRQPHDFPQRSIFACSKYRG